MITFPLGERTALIPMELSLPRKPLAWILPVPFLFSGLGPNVFSLSALWRRAAQPAFLLWSTAISSWLALNFTGPTPFTSPSSVETKMR